MAPQGTRCLMASPPNVTQLLVAWSNGDHAALEDLTPLVHRELHRLAARYMAGERPGQAEYQARFPGFASLVEAVFNAPPDSSSPLHTGPGPETFDLVAGMVPSVLLRDTEIDRKRAQDHAEEDGPDPKRIFDGVH